MLHQVAEPYDFHGDGMEYGLLSPERIAQLDREDLDRYHRSMRTSSFCAFMDDRSRSNAAEAPDNQDELQSQLLVLMDMMERFSSNSKGRAPKSESGSEPPMMDPQPVSTIYQDEPQTDEVSMVVQSPDSEEMKDLDDIKGDGSSVEFVAGNHLTSISLPKSFLNEKETGLNRGSNDDSGLKVLSIYCAYMATKWNRILETRPKQSNDMSVEIYYTQFFDWRKKLEEVNYIGDEDSYIDEFLCGLKTDLAVRVWVYEWKPRTLYGAFHRAITEETMMRNVAHVMFDKNPEQNEWEYEFATMNLHLARTNCDVIKDTTSVITTENTAAGENGVRKVFKEMTGPILEDDFWGIKANNASHYMLDERPTRSLVHTAEDLCGKNDSLSSFSYIIESSSNDNWNNWASRQLIGLSKVTTQDLNYGDGVLEVSVANSPSLSRLGFDAQVFGPGTIAFFKQDEYLNQRNENESQLHCIGLELIFVYSQMYGEFSFYTHMAIELCFCLFEWARSWNDKIDWVLSWNSQEFLSWTCSALFWSCNVAGDDIFMNSNDISTLPHAVWINRPFSIFCVVALAQLPNTFDQAATNGHYMMPISVNSIDALHKPWVKGVTSRMDAQNMFHVAIRTDQEDYVGELNENEDQLHHVSHVLFQGDFSHRNECIDKAARNLCSKDNDTYVVSAISSSKVMFGETAVFMFDPGISPLYLTVCAPLDSSEGPGSSGVALLFSKLPFCFNPDGFYVFYNVCDRSLTRNVQIQVFIDDKAISVNKVISCWILPSDGWTNIVDLAINSGTWLCLLSPLTAYFARDPGICAVSVHILEDKDVFKRVGNRILVMVMIRNGQIKIRVIHIEEGLGNMTTWRYETTCTPTIFSINEVGKSYSSHNRGSGIAHQLFDEMTGPFPIKLDFCAGPNEYLKLPVAAFFKYLDYEGMASEVSSTNFLPNLKFKLNINFWLDAISIFGFYPGTGANEGQWNAYKGHVNVQCIVAFSYGINDHLVRCRPFDPGGCRFPEFDCDPFESVVPTQVHVSTLAMSKVMALYMFCLEVLQRGYLHRILFSTLNIVIKRFQGMEFLQIMVISSHNIEHIQILDTFFLCQYNSIVKDVIGHLRSSYDDAKDGYLQHMEPYGYKDMYFWFCAKVPNACPTSASAIFASYDMYGLVSISNLQMFLKALVFADASMSKTFEMASFPISCTYSCVAHTNVVQDAVLLKIFIWDPYVGHFTTLRTRRLSRGRRCYESSLKLFKDYYVVFKSYGR